MEWINRIYALFQEYLENKIKNKESIKKILSKGESIVNILDDLDLEEKRGLLVGNVQSGKTINFMSVIANSILKGYRIIVILSSTESELHAQTVSRIKESFNINECSNILSIHDCKDSIYNNTINDDEFVSDLVEDTKNKITFFIILKNHQNITKITKILGKMPFKETKILIIDDEGDLASMSSKEKKNQLIHSKTLESIKELYFTIKNRIYLSVTATPQVHLMLSNINEMMPKRVFVAEPCEGYVGISEFVNKSDFYYEIPNEDLNKINNDNLQNAKTLYKSILYYLISWSSMMIENKLDKNKEHSNFLIHTDVKQSKHEEYRNAIKLKIKTIQDSINSDANSIDYINTINQLKNIIKEFEMTNYFSTEHEEDFIEKFKASVNHCKVKIINQKNPNKVNYDLSSILIGSKKLERGITLDNLLVTFFTNRSKNKTAIDTLLQRARWFGYRNDSLKYMKLFTTQQVISDFKVIKRINEDILQLLREAEIENKDFELLDRGIFIESDSKLIPTGKVPINKSNSKDLSAHAYIKELSKQRIYYKKIFHDLKASNDKITFNKKYYFKIIKFENFKELKNKYPELAKNIFQQNINSKNYNDIYNSGYEVIISFMDNIENREFPRERACSNLQLGDYIKYVPQGRNSVYGNDNFYPGDLHWQEYENQENYDLKNKILIQIHYIKPRNTKNISDESLFYWHIFLPKNFKLSNLFRGKDYNK